MDRVEAISLLKSMVKVHEKLKIMDLQKGGLVGTEYLDKRIMALRIAIHSLEVDEKYGLLYMEAEDEKDKG